MTAAKKTCTGCNKSKRLEEYYRHDSGKDGASRSV